MPRRRAGCRPPIIRVSNRRTARPWPATASGRTSSTRKPRPTRSAARSSRASSRKSPSPPAWAEATRRRTRDCASRWTRRWTRTCPRTRSSARSSAARGGLEGASYEEIRYEGYGIGGAAVIVDCMTDNRTRTVADVRHAFSKYGGNLGTDGSVAFLFKHCGQIVFAPGTDEDKVMEAAHRGGRRGRADQRRRQHRGDHRAPTISSRSRRRWPKPG